MKKRDIVSLLAFIIVFAILLDRYVLLGSLRAKVGDSINYVSYAVDYRLGRCAADKIRVNVSGGYLCRAEATPSLWLNIYDTYPKSVDGKEIIYEFLDEGDMTLADGYLENWHPVDRFDPIKIDGPITWEEDPYGERYWRFIFYSLRSTRNLLYAGIETGNQAYFDKLIDIVESFVDNGLDKPLTWDDYHGVAFRTMVLTNTWWKLREQNALPVETSTKLLQALEVHGNFLLAEEHFESGYNHGLTESTALLILAANFPDLPGADEWLSVAEARLEQMAVDLVDDDGALIENSPYYHFYVLQKFWEIRRYADQHDIPLTSEFNQNLSRMIAFGTYILLPNLEVPLLGASIQTQLAYTSDFVDMAKLDPQFLYVLTQGEKGQVPSNQNVYFPATGLTIMRSGWEQGAAFEDQTQVIFDIGPYRTDHSDLDALNLNIYSNGTTLVTDSGLFTYEEGEGKTYFHGTAAHNTVVVDGKDQLEGAPVAGTFFEGDGYAYQTALHDLYAGVYHFRATALLGHDYVLVADHLVSDKEHQYSQLFHLFPEANLDVEGLTVHGYGNEPRQAVAIYQLLPEDVQVSIAKGQESPIDGMCSYEYEHAIPCNVVSYQRYGTEASFITLIEIGEHDDTLSFAISPDQKRVTIQTSTSSYSIDLKFPEGIEVPGHDTPDQILSNVHHLSLFNDNDEWYLLGGEGAPDYTVGTTSDNTLTITRQPSDQVASFEVNVDGVATYYSREGTVYTDIPVDSETQTFRVYEQEDFLPIFGYHDIWPDGKPIGNPVNDMYVSDFAAQVEYATNVMGCRWFTFGYIMEKYVLRGKKTPESACVMTFDDGHRNNYEVVFPVLQKYGVKATFYIITERPVLLPYMSWEQINELYYNGHEIGAHTVSSSGLVSSGWDHSELVYQIGESKNMLEAHGFDVKTFAYPLGERNDEIVQIVKDSGFLAGRDIERDNLWRDRRPPTAGLDDEDARWHMSYYKPEQTAPHDLEAILGYTTWWQFEEEYLTVRDDDGDIQTRASTVPTTTSYGVVWLEDAGDSIANSFLVSESASYTVNLYGTTGSRERPYYGALDRINVFIDDVLHATTPGEQSSCVNLDDRYYCEYSVTAQLRAGEHVIRVESAHDQVVLDKFQVFQTFQHRAVYDMDVLEYATNDLDAAAKSQQIELSITAQYQETIEVVSKAGPQKLVLAAAALGVGVLTLLGYRIRLLRLAK